MLENSIDAGASKIDIEVVDGGTQYISVTDNGSGIPKDELALALSCHATSKIQSIDDLHRIGSLGFRGEALASIASISRFSITSCAPPANTAWMAAATGKDMVAKLSAASHPAGTTVVVEDLFHNTPARRKFLRSAKTEYSHIEALVKKIGLSHPQVHLTLKHNQRVAKRFVPALNPKQQLARLTLILGKAFSQQAHWFDVSRANMRLWGWLGSLENIRTQNDHQFFYVNNRMVRDRVISHGVRQAYSEQGVDEGYPGFVLFFDVEPSLVDVNVHPTKHEVRFVQTRLVHDFITSVLREQLSLLSKHQPINTQTIKTQTTNTQTSVPEAVSDSAVAKAYGGYQDKTSVAQIRETAKYYADTAATPEARSYIATKSTDISASSRTRKVMAESTAVAPYSGRLIDVLEEHLLALHRCGKLIIIHQKYLRLALLKHCFEQAEVDGLMGQPLLIPIRITLGEDEQQRLIQTQALLDWLGIDIQQTGPEQFLIRRIGRGLEQCALAEMVAAIVKSPDKIVEDFSSQLNDLLDLIGPYGWRQEKILTIKDAQNLLFEAEEKLDKSALEKTLSHGRSVNLSELLEL